MKRVFYPDMEMAKQLNEYRVEYQVLQEEMLSVKPQIENMEKLELLNKQLTQQNHHLNEQLEVPTFTHIQTTIPIIYNIKTIKYSIDRHGKPPPHGDDAHSTPDERPSTGIPEP